MTERAAQQLKLRATSAVIAQEFRTGFWVKDERRFVNVREVLPDTTLVGIRIYEFDDDYRLISISSAERGEFAEKNLWRMRNVVRTRFSGDGSSVDHLDQMDWPSVLTPDILSVLFVMPERMSAWNLYQYTRHLSENRQRTERYEIAMWKKLVYPVRGPGHDGARVAVRLYPHPLRERWRQGVLGHHAGDFFPYAEQPVFAFGIAAELVAPVLGTLAKRRVSRGGLVNDVVDGTKVGRESGRNPRGPPRWRLAP